MTIAEDMLWRSLRGRGFEGMKFRRQVPIGPYIADFACLERKLIIELDGRPHEEPDQAAYDRWRDNWLIAQGWRVLRLDNERVIGGAALRDIGRSLLPPSSDPR
jgi:very-short-patch-repair endonuclease